MQDRVKKQAMAGVFWMYAERIVAQFVSLIVSIIIARILDPAHYGIIAIVNIFITICNVFVVTGLGESLIQKKDADELDFSSVFYVNISLAAVLYIVLFFAAPVISKFYGDEYPGLASVLRVMGLRLVLAAINSIQRAKVSRELLFRKFFWVTLFGTIISAAVGIFMATNGFGVWALVAQYMTNSTVDTIMLFLFVRWRPKMQFSLQRVKPLVNYGWKVLAAALLGTAYTELRSLLIGKKYSAEDLAYYEKGNTYPKLIVNNLNSAITSVLFPLMAKSQENSDEVKRILRKSLRTSSFLLFPAMTGLAVIAKPLIGLVLTQKWLPCVPYLQMMCVSYAIMPLSQANLQCITATGHSGNYLAITLAKRVIGILLLVAVFRNGVIWIALSQVAATVVDYIIDVKTASKYVHYPLLDQIKDLSPNLVLTAIMGILTWSVGFALADTGYPIQLTAQIGVGIASYLLLALLFKNETFSLLLRWIKRFGHRRTNDEDRDESL